MPSAQGLPRYGHGWSFFLDVDGTLLEYASHPGGVMVEQALLDLLRRLRAVADGAVALISGRSVRDLDRLFSPLVLPVAGQHGAERRGADGRLHRLSLPRYRLVQAAASMLRLAETHAGLVVEDKGLALAMHYRQAPGLKDKVEHEMRAIADRLGNAFTLQAGKFVLEIKPDGRDKGGAIADFIAEPPFAGRQPVFIGDDLTDELGFELVNRLQGHSVKVGRGETCARWRLVDAMAVRRWLASYVEFCTAKARA